MRIWRVKRIKRIEDYRKLVGCRGLLPGAGLDPPPASSTLPFAGLPANGAARSEYMERAEGCPKTATIELQSPNLVPPATLLSGALKGKDQHDVVGHARFFSKPGPEAELN